MQINPQPQAGIAGVQVPVGMPVIAGNQVQLTYAPVPQGIPHDRNNWGPRTDVAYQLPGDGLTMVKGSAGLYYGRTPMIYFPLRGAGVSNTTLFAPASRFGVTFPEVLPSAIAPGSALATLVGPPAILVCRSRVRESTRASAHRLSDQARGRHVARGRLHPQRVPEPSRRRISIHVVGPQPGSAHAVRSSSVVGSTSSRPAARTPRLLRRTRSPASVGAAIRLSWSPLSKPMSNRWQFYGNYTLAKSTGNGSTERDTEAAFGPSDPFNPGADFGINELDERHQVKSYLVLALPRDITLASTWSAGSGLAFPVYSSTDLNGDGVTNDGLHPDRPVVDGQLLPRFPYHQPAWAMWDFRVAKGVTLAARARMQFMFEVFNLLNTGNTYADARTQAILGSPNFRVHNRTLGPRLAQLGVRFDF